MSGTRTAPRPAATPRRATAMPAVLTPGGTRAGSPAAPRTGSGRITRTAGHGGPGQARRARDAALTGLPRRPAAQGAQRLPFILLLIGLLAGALVCLLMISTTLAEGSFRITQLRQADNALAKQQEQLQQQVASEQAPAMIAQRAEQLGMRPSGTLRFINLRTGRISAGGATGAEPAPARGHAPGNAP